MEDINKILQSFKIKAHCIDYKKNRNLSIYDIQLEPRTRIKEFFRFSDEIALALKIKTKPTIKSIPELGIVRMEIVEELSEKFSYFDDIKNVELSDGIIPMYIGSNIDQNICFDAAVNPHLLIAGTTGSGKTTLINTIIANALRLKNIEIAIIDMKPNLYKNIKNICIADNYISAVEILDFIFTTMESRYKMISSKSIDHFNNDPILFIIDEFADLIMQDYKKTFYNLFIRLIQICRGAGIYCIAATQRPSSDIFKGALKANFPARISCKVASSIDSKIILDKIGAELLLGKGDAIIKNYNNDYVRFQVAYSTPEEVCAFVR